MMPTDISLGKYQIGRPRRIHASRPDPNEIETRPSLLFEAWTAVFSYPSLVSSFPIQNVLARVILTKSMNPQTCVVPFPAATPFLCHENPELTTLAPNVLMDCRTTPDASWVCLPLRNKIYPRCYPDIADSLHYVFFRLQHTHLGADFVFFTMPKRPHIRQIMSPKPRHYCH
jgi:hypothetical protein